MPLDTQPEPGAAQPRPQLNPSFVAWTVLKDLRDANAKIAEQADFLMQAIEQYPAIDAAMVITMGIRAKVPPQMGKPGFEVQPK